MSENKEIKAIEESKKWETNDVGWTVALLAMMFGFGGFGSPESPRVAELEKKVARLEGQMSMIGGKNL